MNQPPSPTPTSRSSDSVESYLEIADFVDSGVPSIAKGLTVRRIYLSRGSEELVVHLHGPHANVEMRFPSETLVKAQVKNKSSRVSTARKSSTVATSCSGHIEEVTDAETDAEVSLREGNDDGMGMHGFDNMLGDLADLGIDNKQGEPVDLGFDNKQGDPVDLGIKAKLGDAVELGIKAKLGDAVELGVEVGESEQVVEDQCGTAVTISEEDIHCEQPERAIAGNSATGIDVNQLLDNPDIRRLLESLMASLPSTVNINKHESSNSRGEH